uniref:Uncharacterized protein n=1 Tax=Caenorhabditis japonica TaxID=281687 RepID=A0A8R1I147_CAEJA
MVEETLSKDCNIVEDIRHRYSKVKKMIEEYRKEKHVRKNPPPPEEIEMTTFWMIIRRPISERKISDPIDIPRIVYEQDW